MVIVPDRFFIKMIKKYFYLILIVILIIGTIFRTVNLDKNPPHLGNDEISIAFDSYSIRTIGKDEHGNSWPLSFQSHNDYKSPLYAYLNIPINWLLGNNEYGIRLLSVIAGVVIIFLVAVIAKNWSNENVALVASIIMAFNPKGIFTSRIAYESNLAVMFVTLGILVMFYFRKNKKILIGAMSGVLLGLSIWAYHTEKGLVPLLVLFLPLLSRKEMKIKKWLIVYIFLIITALPVFVDFVHGFMAGNSRANSQIWLTDPNLQNYLKDSKNNNIKKALTVIIIPINNYLQHFSLDSLFTSGADIFNGESPLESGWFLLVTLPLLILGLINLKVIYKQYWDWILVWWLLCPIVPALTAGGVTSVRNLAFIVPTVLIMAAGFEWIIKRSKNWAMVFSGLFVINFFIFGVAYFIHFPIDSVDNFQYGYKQAWEYIKPMVNDYNGIVVQNKFGSYGQYFGVPHLYFGYFGAFRVEEMQHRIPDNGIRIGKFYFTGVDWNKTELKPKTLYIVSVSNPKVGERYDKLNLLGTIEKPNHETQFLIYETIE